MGHNGVGGWGHNEGGEETGGPVMVCPGNWEDLASEPRGKAWPIPEPWGFFLPSWL